MFTRDQWNKVLEAKGIDPASVPEPPCGFKLPKTKIETVRAGRSGGSDADAVRVQLEGQAGNETRCPDMFSNAESCAASPELIASLSLHDADALDVSSGPEERIQYAVFSTLCCCGFDRLALTSTHDKHRYVSMERTDTYRVVTTATALAKFFVNTIDEFFDSRRFKVHWENAPAEALAIYSHAAQLHLRAHNADESKSQQCIHEALSLWKSESGSALNSDVLSRLGGACGFAHPLTSRLTMACAILLVFRAQYVLSSARAPAETSLVTTRAEKLRPHDRATVGMARAVVMRALLHSLGNIPFPLGTRISLDVADLACTAYSKHAWDVVSATGWDPDDALSLLDRVDPCNASDFPQGE